MNRLTWAEYFMSIAVITAMRSADPSTKVGAVIVDETNTVVTTGYNGFPRDADISTFQTMNDRDEKYKWVIHAETNAIYNAVRQGKSVDGCTLYLTWLPCAECMKAIAQSGIKRVVTLPIPDDLQERWMESFKISREIADKCKIEVTELVDYKMPELYRISNGVIF